ncbi:MAG TPA: cell envelope integrity protein TolA [Rhodanobacteraceae bacterium]
MSDESKRTPRAVLWSALLHIGLAGFLFATTLSCTSWEHVFAALHLPAGWSPIMCQRPQALAGPVIEATLIGTSAAPLPSARRHRRKSSPSPPPKPAAKPVKPKVSPVPTLPAPPKHPALRNQQKAVLMASQKAEQAKRVAQQQEQQRMSELQAEQQAKLNKIFQQMAQTRQALHHADSRNRLEQQKLAQLKDLKKADQAPPQVPGVKVTEQAQSGGNGTDEDAYKAAIQNAVTQAWLRPDNIPEGAVCPIHIVQIPGGQVVSVTIDPSCPFDAAAKLSVKNAVLRAQPLPYKGYAKVFQSDLTLNFKVTN